MTRMHRPTLLAALMTSSALVAGVAQAQTQPPLDEPTELEEIVVTGTRAALNLAIEVERRADNLVNVVAAEDIGQFSDQNVAESLQRVPGISLNRSEGEGRSVSVRGLPSSFTTVTVNGVRLGTSNLDNASVSLDSVSNDQLEQLEVTKSVLPSQDADTIGGSIDLKTISAFTRSAQEIQFRAEGVHNEDAGEWGENLSTSITRRFMDDRLGFAAALSYSRRPTRGIELEADGGLDAVSTEGEDGPEYLRPNEFTIATETGERTRWNGSFNLEFRPDDATEFFLRGTYSALNDDDLAYQDIWVIEESEDEAIIEARPGGGTFDEVELEKRLFFQNIDDKILTLSAGGSHDLDLWDVGYQVDYSRSEFDNPEAMRGRFTVEDVLADLDVTKTGLTVTGVAGDGGDGGDPLDPGDYEFSQLLYIQEFRIDEIWGARIDFGRDLNAFGGDARLNFGAKFRTREKSNDREEFTANPEGEDYEGELEDLPTFDADNPYSGRSFFPERAATFDFFRDARDFLLANVAGYQRIDLSAAGDYVIGEDVSAAYVEGVFDPTPELKVIAGVRVEHTESTSDGFYTEFDSSGRGPGGEPGAGELIYLGEVEKTYTDVFPGLHLNWRPADDLVFRASATRGLQRPDFTDRVNRLRVQFDQNDPTDRDLFAGNPYLDPLRATSLDASAAWYPNRDTVLQAAIFHKDITDFFFTFAGDGDVLDQTPLIIPEGVNPVFSRIETVLNGEEAKVTGLELQYIQTFANLPGLLSGAFVQANLTLVDSEATANVRDGEVFSLPDQHEVVGNLSVGWENDWLSLRLAANHQGEALVALAGDAEEDIYTEPVTFLDFNLRWDVTDNVRLHFDAVNITDEAEIEYHQGDEFGPLVFVNSAFGRTFKVGLRATF